MMNWVVSSTVLIIVIIVLRFFLKGKISLRLQYALWAIVLTRLLVPFSIGETIISVGNWLEKFSQKEEVHEIYEFTQVELPTMSYQQAYEEVADKYESQGIDIEALPKHEFAETIDYEIVETMTGEYSLAEIVKKLWMVGGVSVGIWFLNANFRFRKKLMESRRCIDFQNISLALDEKQKFERICVNGSKQETLFVVSERYKLPIYVCDEIDTPCLFGVFHPSIYVTSETMENDVTLRHVIAHEVTHYLHRDYIWGYFRVLCLAIHWFNPLVWRAALLSRNDAELACDEATIEYLGEHERAAYGRTLIEITCEKRSMVLLTATTMTGGKKSMKERIALIVKRPKTRVYTIIVVIAVSVLCIGCTFTGAKNHDTNNEMGTDISTENTKDKDVSMNGGMDSESYEEELENLREEVEEKKESLENTILYESLSQEMLVTDAEVNHRVLQLLLDEKELIDTIESSCEMDFEQSIEVDGCPYYRVVEADSWNYYEDIAKKYYSEEYLKEEFTKRYIEENKLFVEENGKLYRAAADGVVMAFLKDSVNVWQVGNDMYATITVSSVGGGYFLEGYRIRLSENNIYGYEITDRLYLQTNEQDFEYVADLTHDGVDERIRVSIIDKNTKVKIRVYNDAYILLYETELLLHPNLGESYYLSTYNGKDYLMRYKSDINHDTASCEYEVFYLSEIGEKIHYDVDEMEISLFHVEEINVDAWKNLAEEKNKYFQDAFLLASTIGDKLEYSTDIERITYIENFGWLIVEDTGSIERNLELFLEKVREMYSE